MRMRREKTGAVDEMTHFSGDFTEHVQVDSSRPLILSPFPLIYPFHHHANPSPPSVSSFTTEPDSRSHRIIVKAPPERAITA